MVEAQLGPPSTTSLFGKSFFSNQQKRSALDRLPMDVVSLIFSHLTLVEILEVLPQMSKKWRQVNGQGHFWKRVFVFQSRGAVSQDAIGLNTVVKNGAQGDGSNLANSLIIQNRKVLDALMQLQGVVPHLRGTIAKQAAFYRQDQTKRAHLKLKAIHASSQDYNQSIYCTLNRFGTTDNFWSSEGSDSQEANEHLIYSTQGGSTQENSASATAADGSTTVDLGRVTQVYSFTLAIFNPDNIQGVGFDYPPMQAQLEVGFSKGNFHYKSSVFEVVGGTSSEQEFIVLPAYVLGTHFKVNLIGKVSKQPMDDRYYQALRYVGVSGRSIDKDDASAAQFNAVAASTFASATSSTEEANDAGDTEQAFQLSYEELRVHLSKFNTNGEELFKARELIQVHLDALLEETEEVFGFMQIMHLFEYQLDEYAFYESVSLDVATRMLIHYEKKMTEADVGPHGMTKEVKMMMSLFEYFLIRRYAHLEVEPSTVKLVSQRVRQLEPSCKLAQTVYRILCHCLNEFPEEIYITTVNQSSEGFIKSLVGGDQLPRIFARMQECGKFDDQTVAGIFRVIFASSSDHNDLIVGFEQSWPKCLSKMTHLSGERKQQLQRALQKELNALKASQKATETTQQEKPSEKDDHGKDDEDGFNVDGKASEFSFNGLH